MYVLVVAGWNSYLRTLRTFSTGNRAIACSRLHTFHESLQTLVLAHHALPRPRDNDATKFAYGRELHQPPVQLGDHWFNHGIYLAWEQAANQAALSDPKKAYFQWASMPLLRGEAHHKVHAVPLWQQQHDPLPCDFCDCVAVAIYETLCTNDIRACGACILMRKPKKEQQLQVKQLYDTWFYHEAMSEQHTVLLSHQEHYLRQQLAAFPSHHGADCMLLRAWMENGQPLPGGHYAVCTNCRAIKHGFAVPPELIAQGKKYGRFPVENDVQVVCDAPLCHGCPTYTIMEVPAWWSESSYKHQKRKKYIPPSLPVQENSHGETPCQESH